MSVESAKTDATSPVDPTAGGAPHGKRRRRRRHRHHHRQMPILPRLVTRASEINLAVLVGFAAFAYGGVEAWSQLVLTVLVLLQAALLAARAWVLAEAPILSWLFLPPLALLALAAFQLVPLADGTLASLSPATLSLWQTLDPAIRGDAHSLSLYPHETASQLRVLALAVVVFVSTANLCRSRGHVMRLLGGFTIVGLLVTLLAIAQDFSNAKNLYWVGPPGRGKANAGPFIHYSHFGHFVNLCIFAGLAWSLVTLARLQRESNLSPRGIARDLLRPEMRPFLFPLMLLLAGTAAVLYSGSRTATISLAAGVLVFTAALGTIRIIRGRAWWIMPPILAVSLVAIGLTSQAILDRLAQMSTFLPFEQRVQIIRDCVDLWKQFTWFGTGLGSFEYVYPMVDSGAILYTTTTHAENEYAQLMTEMGTTGIALLSIFVVGVAVLIVRTVRRSASSLDLAAVAIGGAVVTASVHAWSDFALHTPANGLLLAALLGIVVAVGRRDAEEPDEPSASRGVLSSRLAAAAWAAIAVVLATVALPNASRASSAESAMADALELAADIGSQGWRASPSRYIELLTPATHAASLQPGNANYAYRLNYFRWYAITGSRSAQEGRTTLDPTSAGFARRVKTELAQMRALAPTYPQPVVFLEQLERMGGRTAVADALMELRLRLNRSDGDAIFATALKLARAGDWEHATPMFVRAMSFGRFEQLAQLLVGELNHPALARKLAGKDRRSIRALAGVYQRRGETEPVANLMEEYFEVLRDDAESPRADAGTIAEYAQETRRRGDLESAIPAFRRALRLDYGNVTWRSELVHSLRDAGKTDEARVEVGICLRMQPDNESFRQQAMELESKPSASQPTGDAGVK